MDNKRKMKWDLSFKETITSIIVPIIVAVITVIVAGIFQLKAINESSKVQMEAAIKAAEAQIEAAEITKVNKIEYDFKDSYKWNVNESDNYIPLKKGNYWMYSGEYYGFSPRYREYFKKKITMKLEILKEIKNEKLNISFYIVNNYPVNIRSTIKQRFDEMNKNELTSVEPIELINNENKSGLLLVANKLFHIPNKEIQGVVDFLNDPQKVVNHKLSNPSPLLTYDDLLFEFPLFEGQRFGDIETITNPNLSYFWYVNDVTEINALNENKFENVQIFNLIYNTNPDQQNIEFRPYLGIIRYSVTHKGVPDDLYLDLEEFELK
ncbi:hypothetical protein F9U64_01055 [Gracilibacillus oryzae]|uniref:Uncharacterized protein n=1 Tax=Gracilibacillus oryzae TaxID=1672701 RepID=A0A7C8L104_9BACI|nr:hypothetical protein [Gracilibacillus oryzae]KAB8139242.1 hypothetical protein F9U64_01055 [Gracilibacillus oryzae]